MLCYIDTDKDYARKIGAAFAQSLNAEIVTDWEPRGEPAIVVGMDHRARRVIRDCPTFWQVDHAYFGRFRWFKMTRNGFWTDLDHAPDFQRLDQTGLQVIHRKHRGPDVMVACQSPMFYANEGTTLDRWLMKVARNVRRHSSRALLVRHKPIGIHRRQPPVSKMLRFAWCVVVHSSGVALDALRIGIPVVVTEPRYPAASLATTFADVDNPRLVTIDERRELFGKLAAAQFTIEEMRSGLAWARVNGETTTEV